MFPPAHYRSALSTSTGPLDTWRLQYLDQQGDQITTATPGDTISVVFRRQLENSALLTDDVLSIIPIDCLTYTSCEAITSPGNEDVRGLTMQHHRNNFLEWRWAGKSDWKPYSVQFLATSSAPQQQHPAHFVTQSQYYAGYYMEVKCTAMVNLIPGRCAAGVEMKVPMLSTKKEEYMALSPRLDPAGYYTPALTIDTVGDPQWLCLYKVTGRYIDCSDALFDKFCDDLNTCQCTKTQPSATCAYYNATDASPGACSTVAPANAVSKAIDFQDDCNACRNHTDPTKRANWGAFCQVSPSVTVDVDTITDHVGDVISGHLLYTDVVHLNITYQGPFDALINLFVIFFGDDQPEGTEFPPILVKSFAPPPGANPQAAAHMFQLAISLQDTPLRREAGFVLFKTTLASSTASDDAYSSSFPVQPRGYNRAGSRICLNGGVLAIDGTCTCSARFGGEFCEVALCKDICDHTGTAEDADGLICTGAATSTPQCTCRAGFSGATCSIPSSCDVTTPPLSTCPVAPYQAFVFYNATTADCSCECSGHWATENKSSPCKKCGLTCLNQGTHWNQCHSCTCPSVPSSTGRFYYGGSCECAGLSVTARDSITSAKYQVIKEQQDLIEHMLNTTTGSAQTQHNLLSLIKNTDFKAFVMSLLNALVVDYHTRMLTNDPQAAKALLVLDSNGNRVLSDMALQQVQLRRFQVITTMETGFSGQTKPRHDVQIDLLILPSMTRCHGSNEQIDDTNWVDTLNNLKTVATLLNYDEDVDPDVPDVDNETPLTNNDPNCLNTWCQAHKLNSNGAAALFNSHSQLITIVAIVGAVLCSMLF